MIYKNHIGVISCSSGFCTCIFFPWSAGLRGKANQVIHSAQEAHVHLIYDDFFGIPPVFQSLNSKP